MATNLFDLTGQTAVVIGGTGVLGGAMAQALYATGTRTAKGEALSRSAVKRHLQRLGLIA